MNTNLRGGALLHLCPIIFPVNEGTLLRLNIFRINLDLAIRCGRGDCIGALRLYGDRGGRIEAAIVDRAYSLAQATGAFLVVLVGSSRTAPQLLAMSYKLSRHSIRPCSFASVHSLQP
jgi:hypothetical protein